MLALAVGNVLVGVLGIVEDDVPGVDHAREDTKAAECKVDKGVGAADAPLYPDWLFG